MLLGLHFVDLALHYQAQGQSDDSELPLALVGGHPLQVLQCNELAKAAGVAVAQRIGTATALCESLQLLQQDERQQGQALRELADWAYGFSAQVMLVEPDTLVLEASSMLRLFGGIDKWQQQLAEALDLRGLPWRWALAHTPLAATLLARYGLNGGNGSADPVLLALASLSLSQCQRPEATRLESMGVRTLGQLQDLPRAELGQRFGVELLLWLERLIGQRPDPRPWFAPPQHYQRRLVLLHEIEQISVLRFPLKRLFMELGEHLRRRQLALPALTLRLLHRDRPTTELTLKGAGNEHRPESWQKLCELQLERLTLFAPIIEIELLGHDLQPQQLDSESFVAGVAPDGAALRLLAQLQARLGADKVRGIRAMAAHRPELASQAVAPGTGGDRRHADDPKPERPLWLLSHPEAIDVTEFQLLRGPERIESGWWQTDAIARDYFVGQRHDGALGWLYQDNEGWFLHGWF